MAGHGTAAPTNGPVVWDEAQIAMLERRQRDARFHPYTCGGDRSDAAHVAEAERTGRDRGELVPTAHGWYCPACGYRQTWSHETGGPPRPDGEKIGERG